MARPAPQPFVLDAHGGCDCIAEMKAKLFAALCGLTILAVGCVSTVTGSKTPGVPFIKDKIQSRYERPLDEVYQAAKDVVSQQGTLVDEHTIYGVTNSLNHLAKVVEGRINQRSVWVRVEQVEPSISDVTVQTRTQGGGADIDLAAQIDKEIALKLVR